MAKRSENSSSPLISLIEPILITGVAQAGVAPGLDWSTSRCPHHPPAFGGLAPPRCLRAPLGQSRQHVVEVVPACARTGQRELRPLQSQRLHHRCLLKQGLAFRIDANWRELKLPRRAILTCDNQVICSHLQRPGLKIDLPHRDTTFQSPADGLPQWVFYQQGAASQAKPPTRTTPSRLLPDQQIQIRERNFLH